MFTGNNYDNKLSSGSNWGDALASAYNAYGNTLGGSNSKGNYYINSQWLGDGLAKTGLGFMANPKYEEGVNRPLAGANALIGALRQGKFKYPLQNTTNPYNGKITDNNYTYNILKNILPSNDIYSGTIYGNDYNTGFNYPSYNNGGTFGNFGSSVMDFLGNSNDYSRGI